MAQAQGGPSAMRCTIRHQRYVVSWRRIHVLRLPSAQIISKRNTDILQRTKPAQSLVSSFHNVKLLYQGLLWVNLASILLTDFENLHIALDRPRRQHTQTPGCGQNKHCAK